MEEMITAEDIIGMKKADLVEFAAEEGIEVSTAAKVDVIKEEILKALGLKVEPEEEVKEVKPEEKGVKKFKNASQRENHILAKKGK